MDSSFFNFTSAHCDDKPNVMRTCLSGWLFVTNPNKFQRLYCINQTLCLCLLAWPAVSLNVCNMTQFQGARPESQFACVVFVLCVCVAKSFMLRWGFNKTQSGIVCVIQVHCESDVKGPVTGRSDWSLRCKGDPGRFIISIFYFFFSNEAFLSSVSTFIL